MFWRFLRGSSLSPGEFARRTHELWLTRALQSQRPYPRIPLRRVDTGGFDRMMGSPDGRARAETWWNLALQKYDDLPED